MAGQARVVQGSPAETADCDQDKLSELKLQFLASLNHEIRTPLSGILGMTDLLLETRLDSEQQDYVTATRLCAENLLEILNAALEYSALSAGQTNLEEAEFHLGDTVRSAVVEHILRAEAKGLSLYCTLDEDLPELVIGDAVRIRQLLGYLLSNALKFTEEGEVEVLATWKQAGDHGVEVRIAVRDTGIGITSEQMDLIFRSFQQVESGLARRYTGLGMGLALADSLSRLLRATLAVESEPNAGSTFSFTMPLRLPREAPERPSGHPPAMIQPARILVVEDNEVARRIVTHFLERGGYSAHCVEGGQKALDIAAVQKFDLVLMDLQMPGMDGIETCLRLRKVPGYESVPVFALTANADNDAKSLCLAAGMQGFLAKPIQSAELISVVESHLR
jgi:CheY-like chemotaxis protein